MHALKLGVQRGAVNLQDAQGADQQHEHQQHPVEIAEANVTAHGLPPAEGSARVGSAAGTNGPPWFPSGSPVLLRLLGQGKLLHAGRGDGATENMPRTRLVEARALQVSAVTPQGSRSPPGRLRMACVPWLSTRGGGGTSPDGIPALLLHVSLDDLGGDDAGAPAPAQSPAPQHGHHDFRIAPRSHAHEPAVVLEAALLPAPIFRAPPARWSAPIRSCRQSRCPSGARMGAGAGYRHLGHGIGNELPVRWSIATLLLVGVVAPLPVSGGQVVRQGRRAAGADCRPRRSHRKRASVAPAWSPPRPGRCPPRWFRRQTTSA